MTGQGTLTTEGAEYIGSFKRGKADGEGIKTWKSGEKYAGTFTKDLPNG